MNERETKPNPPAPSNLVSPCATFGEGSTSGEGTGYMHDARVGRFVTVGANACIGHDVVIEDHASIADGVAISGYVHIGSRATIGARAVVVNGTAARPLRIGENARVEADAVVTKDVPPNARVAGNPARRLRDELVF